MNHNTIRPRFFPNTTVPSTHISRERSARIFSSDFSSTERINRSWSSRSGSGSLDGKKFTLMKKYLDLIRSGQKTVEGRINSGAFKCARIGDRITFYCRSSAPVQCLITDVNTYPSFKEMLVKEGLKACLPDVTDLSKGIEIYEKIPGYKERASQHGVIALKVSLEVPNEQPNQKEQKRIFEISPSSNESSRKRAREQERSEPKRKKRRDESTILSHSSKASVINLKS
ncbi:ASCH domain-containing protein [Parachlamydia acanthamoebae]|uniref:ASCH domain-containing protein n=1 Tax=Parachlamydia acanthamoebae TaxID=83552 RepID=UPI000750C850|nr:ASCH domain-containing protein [Parachlamydia acanthamoebae]